MKAEKEEIAEEPFVIRPYLKSELAHLYNPYRWCMPCEK